MRAVAQPSQCLRAAAQRRSAFTASRCPSTGAQVPRFAARVQRRSSVQVAAVAAASVYDYTVKDIDGRAVKLDKFKGKVLLVVNLASQCGFTPQYSELAELHNKYASKGLAVLGFPCNQFGKQEPGSNQDIKKFAETTYGVKFPLFAKVDVNGPAADPFFTFLKNQKGGLLGNDIKWNFSKFLVDKEGNVVGRYASTTSPSAIEGDIKKYL